MMNIYLFGRRIGIASFGADIREYFAFLGGEGVGGGVFSPAQSPRAALLFPRSFGTRNSLSCFSSVFGILPHKHPMNCFRTVIACSCLIILFAIVVN